MTARRKLRKLKVQNQSYLWYREHKHAADSEAAAQPCCEVLTLFLAGHKNSPLRLHFKTTDMPSWCVGHPQSGVLIDVTGNEINLNQPGNVAAIIIAACNTHAQPSWQPKTATRALDVPNGLAWLRQNCLAKVLHAPQ